MIELKNILKLHPNCLSSRSSFKSILMDKYPSEKRMVNILTILFECGIAKKIEAKKHLDTNEMQALIVQIENEYGIPGYYSQEAILTWASAFGVTASAIANDDIVAVSQKSDSSVAIQPAFVEGDVDDYEIVQETDGYYISRFNGFEEEEMTIPSMIEGNVIVGIKPKVFKGLGTVKTIHVSEGIKFISDEAFANCSALNSITLPQSLMKLGNSTFAECHCLKEIEIPDAVKEIPKGCFRLCRGLSKVKLPANLETIGASAFEWGMYLVDIHIPVGTKSIQARAFYSSSSLSAAYIPPSVTNIEYGNFLKYEKYGDKPSWNMTIYCTQGSVAMEYARKNNIKCAKAQF